MSSKDNNSHEIMEKDLKYREKQYIDIYLIVYAINSFPIRNCAGNFVIKLSFARTRDGIAYARNAKQFLTYNETSRTRINFSPNL